MDHAHHHAFELAAPVVVWLLGVFVAPLLVRALRPALVRLYNRRGYDYMAEEIQTGAQPWGEVFKALVWPLTLVWYLAPLFPSPHAGGSPGVQP